MRNIKAKIDKASCRLVDLVIPEMEWHATRCIVDVGRIHPRTNREGMAPFQSVTRVSELSAPGMELASLPKLFIFSLRGFKTPEADLTYANSMLEYSNDVVHRRFRDVVTNEERQCWPDIQGLPCRCSGRTIKLQIQSTW